MAVFDQEKIRLFDIFSDVHHNGSTRFFQVEGTGYGELIEQRIPPLHPSAASLSRIIVRNVSVAPPVSAEVEPNNAAGWPQATITHDAKSIELIQSVWGELAE